jgi:hypothetical protein
LLLVAAALLFLPALPALPALLLRAAAALFALLPARLPGPGEFGDVLILRCAGDFGPGAGDFGAGAVAFAFAATDTVIGDFAAAAACFALLLRKASDLKF